MIEFSETQLQIMEALARYKYLTSSQLVKLGITGNRRSIYRAISNLPGSRTPYIDRKNFPPIPGVGKIESVYFLSPKAAEILASELDYEPNQIRYPRSRQSFFARDYYHRLGTVDFQIAWDSYRKEHNLSEIDFRTYFDFEGANHSGKGEPLRSLTRIPVEGHGRGFIVPDAVFRYEQEDGNERLFLYELANGRDANYIMKQIYGHAHAIAQGTPQATFRSSKGGRVLYAFEIERTLYSVRQRFSEDASLSPLKGWFFFGLHQDVLDGFNTAWTFCDRTSATFN